MYLWGYSNKLRFSLQLLCVVSLFCLFSCGDTSSGTATVSQQNAIAEMALKADLQFGPIEDDFGDLSNWTFKRAQISQKISAFLGDMPGQKCALDPQVLSEEVFSDYVRKKVSYQVESGERITAYLLIPIGFPLPCPAVLALHQTVEQGKLEPVGIQGDPSMSYGLELVRRGYVVLSPDTITAGERVGINGSFYDTTAFDIAHPNWSAMGKMLWDHQRGIDYLQSLHEVNRDRIGVIGHSLGGYNSLFLAAFDERIKAVVASCPYTRIQSDPGKERWSRTTGFIHFPKLRPYVAPGSTLKVPWDFDQVLALIAPRPVIQSFGLYDVSFPNSITAAQIHMKVMQLYSLYNLENNIVTSIYEDGHGFPDKSRKTAYEFLLTHL